MQQDRFSHRNLWPLGLLVVVEFLGLGAVAFSGGLPFSRLSALVAGVILACALLLPLLQPTPATRLAGTMMLLLAGLLFVPFDLDSFVPPGGSLAGALLNETDFPSQTGLLLLRLLNGLYLFPLGLHLSARFPERQPGQPAPGRRSIAGVYLITTLFLLLLLFLPAPRIRSLLLLPITGWLVGLTVYATLLQLRLSRDPDPAHQHTARQARLILLAFWLAEAPLALRLPLFALGLEIPYDLILLAQLLLPLGLVYAIRRHQLFGIDAAVRRALGHTVVLTVIIGLYMGLMLLLSFLLVRLAPQFRPGLALMALLLAAAVFQPVYRQTREAAERIFYPERRLFRQAIEQLQETLAQVQTPAEIETLLTRTLPRLIGADWAALSLFPAPEIPDRPDELPAWNRPLRAGSQVLGRYWLGKRQSGIHYSSAEQAALQGLTNQAALALAYARVVEELNRLNQDLEEQVARRTEQLLAQQRVLAAAEERQRLARDLHDSVTQTLFSINLSARAWRKMSEQDPAAAVEGLQEQEAAAQQALGEMRRLLAQLRSPLDESSAREDLVPTLRQQCLHLAQQTGLQVGLDLPPTCFLPAEISQALLPVAREALHNAARHSGAERARCRLWTESGRLCLQIEDDGIGFDPAGQAVASAEDGYHLGLDSMQQRLAEIGGRLTINSQPGRGTQIQASIPIDKHEA